MSEEKKAPAKKAPAKQPQDRKPKASTKAQGQREARKQGEVLSEFMSAGIDFSPFVIDPGDGNEWSFTPDPMPWETERLRNAMSSVYDAMRNGEGAKEAAEELVEAIRDRMTDEKQKEKFPLPNYGQNALIFFAMHLATGRDGFPTEED